MKSPIKARPLNNPGDSLDKRLQDVATDEILLYSLIALLFIIMALLEWWRWYVQVPPSPVLFTVCAVVASGYAAWKIRKALKKIKNIKLGLAGEKAVGQFLELLRENGAKVFHDVQGEKFNLDHVIIHPSGIYVVETKTISKPDHGEAKLVYDGERILKNSGEMDRKAIIQVQAGSKWLAELLESTTGHKFCIRPVVVYPGWYIESTPEAKSSNVWVLNPKALPAYINKSRFILTPEQVSLCSHHLSKHIRAS